MDVKHFILGLDISTSCSGYCLLPLDSSDLKNKGFYGKIITEWRHAEGAQYPTPAPSYFHRVDWLLEELDKIIEGKSIAACGQEQLNSFRGGEVTRQLVGISKIVQYHLRNKHKINVNEIHTTTIKKVMGMGLWEKGQGSPKKPDMVRFANARFGLDLVFANPKVKTINGAKINLHPSDDDTADAVAVSFTLREEIGADLTRQLLS